MMSQPIKPQILVVDDHPANRMAFETVLEKEYSVATAASGPQALDLAKRLEFAVILLDVRMPQMDGFQVAELLRKQEKTRYTPIIFTSAFDQNLAQIKLALGTGATDFLFSPVDEDLLKLKVAIYSAMSLRNDAMRIKIEALTTLVQSLHVELAKRGPLESVLKAKVKELEGVLAELRREMAPVP